MITVSGIHKSFGKVKAVRGVSFEAPDGKITGLLGPNGAGKSTFLKILLGLLPASSGSVEVLGFEASERSLDLRQKVGYMPANDGSGLEESWMTFDELKDLAGHLNKDGMFDPETSPREVTMLEHTDMIANVKLVAAWGIDYIHLTKNSGEWMIMNVMWEIGSH